MNNGDTPRTPRSPRHPIRVRPDSCSFVSHPEGRRSTAPSWSVWTIRRSGAPEGSSVMSETTTAGQNIAVNGVPNLRDLGGWSASGGRVRSGLIYRSAEFSGLEGDAAEAFAKLGIRSV